MTIPSSCKLLLVAGISVANEKRRIAECNVLLWLFLGILWEQGVILYQADTSTPPACAGLPFFPLALFKSRIMGRKIVVTEDDTAPQRKKHPANSGTA
jgi:hypothetical protein